MPSVAPSDAGLYVHIPFCVRKCSYCAFYSVPLGGQDPGPLLDAMVRELALYAPTEPVKTLYIGGGSPTCLAPELLCGLIASITERVGHPDEMTVECNPAQATAVLFESLRRCGVNRISIGAQSFIADELKTLGRLHSVEAIGKTVQAARRAGIENVALDLIFGIPGSTVRTFADSLAEAIALEPTHVSAYSLTWEEGTPLTRALTDGRLAAVSEDDERAMYEVLCETLARAGYRQYEISNFARGGYECRHNRRYWLNQPVIGLGPAAAGWYRGQRTINVTDIDEYIAQVNAGRFAYASIQQPGPLQIASETAILGLRLTEGIDIAEFYRAAGYDLLTRFTEAIAVHTQTGLLERTDTHLRLTRRGRSFADAVACDFVLE